MAPRPRTGVLFAIVFGLPILLALPIGLFGAKIYQTGTLAVHVVEKGVDGTRVDVVAPAAILPMAAAVVPFCRIDGESVDPEIRAAMHDAVDILTAMRDAPDGVYVDVRTRTEMVRIEKRGGIVEIEVDTPEELVRTSIPLEAVRSALGFL